MSIATPIAHGAQCHPEVYHLENLPEQRKKAHWDREELVLVHEELRAEAEGLKRMNKYLHPLFPSRTYDSIKSQRRVGNTSYRQILSTLRAKHQALKVGGPSQATPNVAEGTKATSRMRDCAS